MNRRHSFVQDFLIKCLLCCHRVSALKYLSPVSQRVPPVSNFLHEVGNNTLSNFSMQFEGNLMSVTICLFH